jgi:23S rRNA (guanosine2251-2'-O)-methyltransferase
LAATAALVTIVAFSPAHRLDAAGEILYGIHPVTEALRAGRRRFFALYLNREIGGRLKLLADMARRSGLAVSPASPAELNALCGSTRHQGAAARVGPFPLTDFSDLAGSVGMVPPLIMLLDQIVDPHNLGAIARTALCTGVDGIVIPKDHAVRPTPAVARASAGALEHTRLACVTNMARAVDQLKEKGVWVVGLDPAASLSVFDTDLTVPLALVVGAEEKGIRPLVRAGCDLLVAVPQVGPLGSFNASVAAAIVMVEAMRQRRQASSGQLKCQTKC